MLNAIAGNRQGCVCIEGSICTQGRCNDDPKSWTVSIVITDSCPECESDHLDLQVSPICQIRPFLCQPKMIENVIKFAGLYVHICASSAASECLEPAGCSGAIPHSVYMS